MTDATELPRHIVLAMEGKQTLVLRPTTRIAHDAMMDDRYMITGMGYDSLVESTRSAIGLEKILFKTGGWVRYLGGEEHHLEMRLRGMRVAYVQNGSAVDPRFLEHIVMA